MSKLEFPGKIGQVSGFDAENDATVMLVLESLLAGYAKIAVQPTGTDMRGRNIVMRPVDMRGYGRHFFLLPKNNGETVYNHTLFRAGYREELKTEADSRKRTVIRSLFKEQVNGIQKADADTVVGPNDERIPSRFPISFEVDNDTWELCYLDVKEQWKNRDYFVFMVKSTFGTNHVNYCFLSFFKRDAELSGHEGGVLTYLRHLAANNVSDKDIVTHTFSPEKVDFIPAQSINGKSKVIKFNPINADTVKINEFALPSIGNPRDWRILPSVVFSEQGGYVLTPWAHGYASLLMRYIRVISDSLVFGVGEEEHIGDQIVKIDSMRSAPDFEVALGEASEELVIITVAVVSYTKRHLPTIAIRHSNMARLVFGSNGDWERRYREVGDVVSTPGFGCLDNRVCRKAVAGMTDGHDSTWLYFTSSATKNGDINEMLGRTSDEIDQLLFDDATFYRSFVGKSCSYVDAVAHWMRQQKEPIFSSSDIDQMRQRTKEIYKSAFGSYIQNVIGSVFLTDSTGSSSTIGSRSNYVQVLQSGYVFRGYSSRSTEDKDDTTKLIYHIDSSKYLAAKAFGAEHNSKRIDGGLYLYADKMRVKPKTSRDILAKKATDPSVTAEKIREAYDNIISSAFCPYGYVARALFKIMRFSANHVEFFPTTRVHGLIGGEVGLYKPTNCIVSKVSVVTGAGQDAHLEARPIQYFVNHEDKKSEEMNKEHLSSLRNIKRIWFNYVFTRAYIRSLLPLKEENDGNLERAKKNKDLNQERYFARELARTLRQNHAIIQIAKTLEDASITEEYVRSTKQANVLAKMAKAHGLTIDELRTGRDSAAMNIYDLLPYHRAGASGSNQNPERLAVLEQKYPNVTRNFYSNCDMVYMQDRLNLLWSVHQSSNLQSEPYTNLDYVHGFLLAENFILVREGRYDYPMYLNRDQYLAMSASVLYADQKIVEYIDFMNTEDVETPDDDESSSSDGESSAPAQPQSRFWKSRYVDEEDVVELFKRGRVGKVVFANIADVPVYNVDAKRDNEGDVFVSTLNEALSVNSSFVALLARSLHVKEELRARFDKSLEFGFIEGREFAQKQGVTELSEYRRTAPAGVNLIPPEFRNDPTKSLAELVGVAGVIATDQEGQDMVVRTSYSLGSSSIVTRVRNQLVSSAYIPKHGRAQILIKEAEKNRTALRLLQPVSKKNANEKSLIETVVSAEIQAPQVIRVDGDYTNDLPVAPYSEEDVQQYYQMLGIA